jgi:GNAT superfamily N-acetyltransferase
MQITPLSNAHLPAAAALFAAGLRRQRALTPTLPAILEDVDRVVGKLASLIDAGPAFAAWEDGRLASFLGSFLVPGFRGTARKGAYVPEWGHGTIEGQAEGHAADAYRALYRAAAAQWAAAGCQVHAISILAHDRAAVELWFWNGFGLAVVDAVRPVQPLAAAPVASPLTIRKATPADAAALASLDEEHCRHYTAAPVFMTPPHPNSAAEFAAFMGRRDNSVWLAMDGETPAGFLRFDGYEIDGVGILEGGRTAFINGAFLRPAYRGRRATPAMLDAALRDYAGQGFTCCATNFEAFNPEAARFWPRYFDPVCLSLTRIPEIA